MDWSQLLKDHGSIVVVLLIVATLFYKLVWNVWNAAMTSKDREIERLVAERDKYQGLFMERLQSAAPPVAEAKKDPRKETR